LGFFLILCDFLGFAGIFWDVLGLFGFFWDFLGFFGIYRHGLEQKWLQMKGFVALITATCFQYAPRIKSIWGTSRAN
jgi:hypothetical protein